MSSSKVVLKVVNICLSMLILLVVVFGLMKLGQTSYEFGYRVFTESAMEASPGTDKSVQIEKGMSSKEIATMLKEQGLIRDTSLFLVQFKLSSYSNDVVPGTYTLNTSMKSEEMMKIIAGKKDKDAKEK